MKNRNLFYNNPIIDVTVQEEIFVKEIATYTSANDGIVT